MEDVNKLVEIVIGVMNQKGSAEPLSGYSLPSSPSRKSFNNFDDLSSIFDDRGFEVKQYGLLKIKYEKMVRFSSSYELQFFKSADANHKYQSAVSVKEIESIRPKAEGSRKLIITFKNSKKYKPTKLMFKSLEESDKFLYHYHKLLDIVENSASAVVVRYFLYIYAC